MVLPRVFALLSITLCLVFFLYAHATVSKPQAHNAVTDIQTLTMQTLQKAQQKYTNAQRVKQDVESRMEKAEKASSEAEKAAQGNTEAETFAEKAKTQMQECRKLYQDAKTTAAAAVPVMKGLKAEAAKLNNEAESNVTPNTAFSGDSAQPSGRVTTLKAQREEIEKKIKAAQQQLESADAALSQLSNHAEKAEVAKDQVKAIVTVAQIQTLLTDADADIGSIQEKKDKVDAIVEELGETAKKVPEDLMPQSVTISDKAEGYQREITRIIKKVQEDRNAMLEHKNTADRFLETIKTATDESQVRIYLRGITEYVGKAEELLKKINKAVTSADIYVKNVNYRKQEMLEVISPKTSKPTGKGTTSPKNKQPEGTAESGKINTTRESTKEQNNTNPSPLLREATTQPTSKTTGSQKNTKTGQTDTAGTKPTSESTKEQKDTNPGQYLQEVTTKQMNEDTKGQSFAKPDKHAESATTKVTSEGTEAHMDSKHSKYVVERLLSTWNKENVSPPGTSNDGAITVSFSLPLALMVCAYLH